MITTVYDKEKFTILAKKMGKSKSFKFIFICGTFILALGLIYLGISLFDKESGFEDYLFAVLDILIGLFFMFYKLVFTRILTRQKNLGKKEQYDFEEDGLKIKSFDKDGNEIVETKLKYSSFYSLEIFEGYIFLYLNKISAIMINEQEFRSLENANNILIYIKQSMDNAKQSSNAK